jgi:hypothetical protein
MQFEWNDGGRSLYFKGKRTADCVIRAISIAEKKRYIDIFEKLTTMGLEVGRLANDDKIWQSYLRQRGWIEVKHGRTAKLLREYDLPRANIAVLNRHLTAVLDNTAYDTWDTTAQKCWRVWHPGPR